MGVAQEQLPLAPRQRRAWWGKRGMSGTGRHVNTVDLDLQPVVDPMVVVSSFAGIFPLLWFFVYASLEGRAREAGRRVLVAKNRLDRLRQMPAGAVAEVDVEDAQLTVQLALEEFRELNKFSVGSFNYEFVKAGKLSQQGGL